MGERNLHLATEMRKGEEVGDGSGDIWRHADIEETNLKRRMMEEKQSCFGEKTRSSKVGILL